MIWNDAHKRSLVASMNLLREYHNSYQFLAFYCSLVAINAKKILSFESYSFFFVNHLFFYVECNFAFFI